MVYEPKHCKTVGHMVCFSNFWSVFLKVRAAVEVQAKKN